MTPGTAARQHHVKALLANMPADQFACACTSAAHAIAMAIAARLRSDLVSQHAGITRQAASAGG